MTQNEKDLLLKDLCARLPYGVKVQAFRRHSEEDPTIIGYPYTLDFIMMSIMFKDNIEEYKPYLFPMSSMTEEQQIVYGIYIYEIASANPTEIQKCINKLHKWLNENHFDYNDLIPMGMANDATNKNIY